MINNHSVKLVTAIGDCFEVAFQRAMEVPPSVLYHFHVTDLAKKRGLRLVSVLAGWTLQVEVLGYESRIETVSLNAIRRAFESGVLSFDSPPDERNYRQISLEGKDFQNQLPKSDADVRQYIIQKAYWLAYRFPMHVPSDGIIFPVPFDEAADLDCLGVEPTDIRRIIHRLANQGLLEKILEGNARPTEKLLSDYESKAGLGVATTGEISGERPEPLGGSDDRTFARLAIDEARKSVPEQDGRTHPKVGAVVVKNGRVLSSGHRGEVAGNHAEYIALEKKLADDVIAGATVYTTLEPCTTRNPPDRKSVV